MLRLLQYERLMKTLLAHHELIGSVDTLEEQRASSLERVADKTMGTLVLVKSSRVRTETT